MSYCRFSSDDFTSDLYVYEGGEGVVIHVASRRYGPEYVEALPAPVALDPDDGVAWEAWVSRRAEVSALGLRHELHPIGLPHDGGDLYGLHHDEAAEIVDYLEALGYRVPAGVAALLREDAQFPEGATA